MQYAGPANLVARQSIYAFQQPRIRLYEWALSFAGLSGGEVVVDVGCGNGGYLGELRRAGHGGLTLGLDLSMGMVAAVAEALPGQPLAQGDASALPLCSAVVDACLAMHMLYHVADPRAAVRELRRVVRPGGCALVVLNREGHNAELRQLVERALAEAGYDLEFPYIGRVLVPEGAALLAEEFASVETHTLDSELVVPDPEPVVAYAGSVNLAQLKGIDQDAVLASVRRLAAEEIRSSGAFRIRSATGCLVARP